MKTTFIYKTIALSVLLVGLSELSAWAQEEMFKVLSLRGNVAVVKPNADKMLLATGRKLYKDENLEISDNSYISLMHRSGRTIEMKTPGVHPISELSSKFGTGTSSVSERYANFVFGEATREREKDMKKNHQQYMAVTGAVVRSAGKPSTNASALQKELNAQSILPASSDVVANTTVFRWKKLPSAKSYNVVISDMFDQTLLQKEITDTVISIDFVKLGLKNAKMCLLSLSAKNGADEVQAGKIGLRFVQGENLSKMQKEITQIKAETEGTAVGKVILGVYYEEHHLYLDALNSYSEAVTAEPENADFRDAYNKFLTRIGLQDE